MSTEIISTLPEFIEWSSQFNFGQCVFRGVSKKSYDISSSTHRLIRSRGLDEVDDIVKNNRELIGGARHRGHDQKDGRRLSDLELLAELQHFEVPTCLIDFTTNPQIALWFACQESNSGEQEDGKVVVLRYDDITRFRKVTFDLLTRDIKDFFGKNIFYLWQPGHQNKRIITQQSVFVFGGNAPTVKVDAECIIIESQKKEIGNSLVNVSGITQEHIYPDIEGFIRMYKRDPSLLNLTVQEYSYLSLQEIVTAMQEIRDHYNQEAESARLSTHRGYLDLAVSYCSTAIEMMIDSSTPEDNPDLVRFYYIRGFAYNLIGGSHVDDAIKDYDEAIKLDPNHREAYFNRGLIRVDQGEWDNARSDFTTARDLGFDLSGYFNGLGGMALLSSSIRAALPEDITEMLTQP